MTDLPLNSVGNMRDSLAQTIDDKNFARSPIKLTTTEKRVIGGLKKLTDLLFQQHFKSNRAKEEDNVDSDSSRLQSDEVTTSIEQPSSSDMPTDADKENGGKFQQFLDNAMQNGAEHFCAMVVQNLKSDDQIHHSEQWHRDQLNAYNLAHDRLFERVD